MVHRAFVIYEVRVAKQVALGIAKKCAPAKEV